MAAKRVELRVVTSANESTSEAVVKLKKAVFETLSKGAIVTSYNEELRESNRVELDASCDVVVQP